MSRPTYQELRQLLNSIIFVFDATNDPNGRTTVNILGPVTMAVSLSNSTTNRDHIQWAINGINHGQAIRIPSNPSSFSPIPPQYKPPNVQVQMHNNPYNDIS